MIDPWKRNWMADPPTNPRLPNRRRGISASVTVRRFCWKTNAVSTTGDNAIRMNDQAGQPSWRPSTSG